MNDLNSEHPEFIKAFVEYCYDQGLNEKQAADLLDTAVKRDMLDNSPEFHDGLQEGVAKSAMMNKALKLPAPLWKTLGAAGAGGATYTMAPEGMSPEQAMGAGIGTGLGVGGLLLAAKNPAAAGKFLTGMVPYGRTGKTLISPSGVVTQHRGLRPFKPLATMGKAITHKDTPKFLGRGLGYGTALGAGGYGAAKLDGGGSDVLKPWYLREDEGGGGGAAAETDPNDPFGYVPAHIRAKAEGRPAPGPGGEAAGPAATVQQGRRDLQVIEQQMLRLGKQIEIAKANANTPTGYMQLRNLRDQQKALFRQRIMLNKSIRGALDTMDTDIDAWQSSARDTLGSAARRGERLDSSFQRVRDSLESSNPLVGLWNRATGAEERLRRIEAESRRNQALMDQANEALAFDPASALR